MFLKVTSSPATVKTLKSPPVPTYKTHPSLGVYKEPGFGMSTVSLKTTGTALLICNF